MYFINASDRSWARAWCGLFFSALYFGSTTTYCHSEKFDFTRAVERRVARWSFRVKKSNNFLTHGVHSTTNSESNKDMLATEGRELVATSVREVMKLPRAKVSPLSVFLPPPSSLSPWHTVFLSRVNHRWKPGADAFLKIRISSKYRCRRRWGAPVTANTLQRHGKRFPSAYL